MGGYTGKRARPAGICFRCGQQIQDSSFERSKEGDSHCMYADGKHHCEAIALNYPNYPCVPTVEPIDDERNVDAWDEGFAGNH